MRSQQDFAIFTNISNVDNELLSIERQTEENPKKPKAFQKRKSMKNQQVIDIFNNAIKAQTESKITGICQKILGHPAFSNFINILTLYALWGDDFRLMLFNRNVDAWFNGVTLMCLVLFSVEIILSIISNKTYWNSFFFWLDTISTLTLLLDITWISERLFSQKADAANTASIARAGRASRIGTKAGRVVRLVRLLRFVKLYKKVQEKSTQKEEKPQVKKLTLPKINEIMIEREDSDPSSCQKSCQSVLIKSNEFSNQEDNDSNKLKEICEVSKDYCLDDQQQNQELPEIKFGNKFKQNKIIPLEQIEDAHSSPGGKQNKFVWDQEDILKEKRQSVNLNQKMKFSVWKKKFGQTEKKKQEEREEKIVEKTEEKDEDQTKESRVGKKLSELTTKRVIILVLVLLLCIPIFNSDYFYENDKGYLYDIANLAAMIENGTIDDVNKTVGIIMQSYDSAQTAIVQLECRIVGVNFEKYEDLEEELRPDEYEQSKMEVGQEIVKMTVSMKFWSVRNALCGACKTVFVCLVLTFGALFFSKDANNLALRPIEKMIEKVNKIAADPLVARTMQIEENDKENETYIIENAIIKIGTLLALGFGEAGSQIIAQNMKREGDVNAMVAGEMKQAIFGFCDIRQFAEATENLQEDVMVFVNSIAFLVHKNVDRYGGNVNKNIGDCFLLVWKIPTSQYQILVNKEVEISRSRRVKNLCDCSLLAFLKIISGINRKPNILAYRNNEKLLQISNNYRVAMGFGLHIGWGIEGAIGSTFKIDASYLSPNVNMASRLEAATKQFGVYILVSSELYNYFSTKVQKICRLIDRVTVKGSKKPIGLYTVDCSVDQIPKSVEKLKTKEEIKYGLKIKKEQIQETMNLEGPGQIKINALFEDGDDLTAMLMETKNIQFQTLFSEGLQDYFYGLWENARDKFEKVLQIGINDGPSRTLLNYMKEFKFEAPKDWQGFRSLTEK